MTKNPNFISARVNPFARPLLVYREVAHDETCEAVGPGSEGVVFDDTTCTDCGCPVAGSLWDNDENTRLEWVPVLRVPDGRLLCEGCLPVGARVEWCEL